MAEEATTDASTAATPATSGFTGPVTAAPAAVAAVAPGSVLAIPFSFAGTLTPGLLSMRFPLIGTWRFLHLSIVCVKTSAGSDIVLDVMYNTRTIYDSPAAHPRVAAGAHVGTSVSPPVVTSFTGRPGNPGVFACGITAVGSASPGADLTLALYLTSA
jgi:hypothetical protein